MCIDNRGILFCAIHIKTLDDHFDRSTNDQRSLFVNATYQVVLYLQPYDFATNLHIWYTFGTHSTGELVLIS